MIILKSSNFIDDVVTLLIDYFFFLSSAIENKEKVALKKTVTYSKSLLVKDNNIQKSALVKSGDVHKNLDVTFASPAVAKPESPKISSSLLVNTNATHNNVNSRKWLPDLDVLPHVIR